MASYDKSKDKAYTLAVQSALQSLGANLGSAGVDGKWGQYTESAYRQNHDQVDRLISGVGGASGSLAAGPQLIQIPMPSRHSYSDFYAMGDALEAAQYLRQKQNAQKQLDSAQEQLEKQRLQARANVEASATSRGFGRSTYVTDALQNTDQAANTQRQNLLADFSQTLLLLDAQRHSNAAAYASSAYNAQESRMDSILRANVDILNQQAMAAWNAQQANAQALLKNALNTPRTTVRTVTTRAPASRQTTVQLAGASKAAPLAVSSSGTNRKDTPQRAWTQKQAAGLYTIK